MSVQWSVFKCACVCLPWLVLQVYDEASKGYVQVKEVATLDITAKPKRFKLLRGAREKLLRLWSRFFSRKPRISAKEVLRRMKDLGILSKQ